MPRGHKSDCQCIICKAKRGETKGKNAYWYGTKRPPDTLLKISIHRKGKCSGKDHYLYGKGHLIKGEKNPHWKKEIDKPRFFRHCSVCGLKICNKSGVCRNCRNKLKAQVGSDHPHWRGGAGYAPYSSDWLEVRIKIKERDNYTCQVCGIINKSIAAHHIDYNKLNNDENNLICLCNSCHAKTTMDDRIYWQQYFKHKKTDSYGKG